MWHRMNLVALVIASTLSASGVAEAARSAADQALYEKAVKDCSSPKWTNGATPSINYAGGWYRCVEPRGR